MTPVAPRFDGFSGPNRKNGRMRRGPRRQFLRESSVEVLMKVLWWDVDILAEKYFEIFSWCFCFGGFSTPLHRSLELCGKVKRGAFASHLVLFTSQDPLFPFYDAPKLHKIVSSETVSADFLYA